jgi:hypothetical protein
LGREYTQRFSFCCAIDGCRSRATPPSLRFLGRKVYCAAIIVVAATMWARHYRAQAAAAERRHHRQPPHTAALAGVVAQAVHGDALLANGARQLSRMRPFRMVLAVALPFENRRNRSAASIPSSASLERTLNHGDVGVERPADRFVRQPH